MKLKHPTLSLEVILTIVVLLLAAGNEGRPISKKVTVVGIVYCESCMQNTFSKHKSYFLQGVDVQVECNLKAGLESSERIITYALTGKTDKFGIYRIKLPSLIIGYECRDGHMIESFCQATVKKNPSTSCNIHVGNTTTEMIVRSGRGNSCIFFMKPLKYRLLPVEVSSICGKESVGAFNNSEFLWPPLQNIPWFPLPFPSWPHLPTPVLTFPMPQFPKPSFPLPFPFSPSQPMPSWPHLPPISSLFPPPKSTPSPPFSLGDPPSWFPYWIPPSAPPSQSPNRPSREG